MRNTPAHATLYTPENETEIKGTVQIVHGMAEHQRRYKDFAEFLKSNGYFVVTSDLRGHGENVTINEELGYFGENGVSNLVGDIHEITRYIKERYPSLPYFLFGHSMGTLISTIYIKKYDIFLDGLFLSGMPAHKGGSGLSSALIDLSISRNGEYFRSEVFNNKVNGPFSRPFRKDGSDFAWLASDPGVWKAYEADPKCGFIFTLNGFKTLLQLNDEAYGKNGTWSVRNAQMPIRLISGSKDPCMGGKRNLQNNANMFRSHGYRDVEVKIFEGCRHEILNDKDHLAVYDYILSQMNSVAGS